MRPARSALLSVCLCACAGSPAELPAGVSDPALAAEHDAMARKDQDRRTYEQMLLTLDQSMASYAIALANQGDSRSDQQARSLRKLISDIVNGAGGGARVGYEGCVDQLLVTAADGTVPANQGIALAALGFASGSAALERMINGAQLSDERLVDRAVFGLAMRQDPKTPPGVLKRIVDDENHGVEGRVQAAWALHELQETSEKRQEIVDYWLAVLGRGLNAMPDGVTAQAVRGLGLTRDSAHAGVVAQFTTHATPRVRMNAAIALGRMNAQKQVPALLALLGPAETVPNVRLAARKALADLAGGQDHGYDVDQWRRVFDRGND